MTRANRKKANRGDVLMYKGKPNNLRCIPFAFFTQDDNTLYLKEKKLKRNSYEVEGVIWKKYDIKFLHKNLEQIQKKIQQIQSKYIAKIKKILKKNKDITLDYIKIANEIILSL